MHVHHTVSLNDYSREEAPSIFLYTQNDTLGISKKVAYEARPDEWLWLFAAKPAN